MGKIFISYRRDDSLMVAKSMYDWLSQRFPRNDIFMDVDSIAPGVDFRAPIETAIIQSDIVFVLIGPKWLAITDANGRKRLENPNDFVRFEIEMAMRHKIPIVPLLVKGATMPALDQLPATIMGLAYLQAIPIAPGAYFNQHMERVASAINLYAPSVQPAANLTASTALPQRRPGGVSYPWIVGWAGLSIPISLIAVGSFIALQFRSDYTSFVFGKVSFTAFLIGYPMAIVALIMVLVQARQVHRQDIAAGIFFGTLFFALVGLPGILPLWFGLRGPRA
jgi:hypothetical protein